MLADDDDRYLRWIQEHGCDYPLPVGMALGAEPGGANQATARWQETLARTLRDYTEGHSL